MNSHSTWEGRVREFENNAHKISLKMRRICAWCSFIMESGDGGALTTHSMCESCAVKFLTESEIKYGEIA